MNCIPPSIQLYSVFHKEAPVPAAPFVVPIQVGAAYSSHRLPMLHDDDGENISLLNSFYSELTACYWIWKHGDRSRADAWGLCHYRRYFSLDMHKLLFKKRSRFYYTLTRQHLDAVVNEKLYKKLQQLLSENDVVVQRPSFAHKEGGKVYTIEEAYAALHFIEHWNTTLQIVQEKYPLYASSIPGFNNETKMSFYNMMVARWAIWDDYLSWVFDILFEVQQRIAIPSDPYQGRIFGFLSERLLNLYIRHNHLSSGYLTIALFEK